MGYLIVLGQIQYFQRLGNKKENSSDGNYSGALTLSTRTNGASITERMRIDSSGNVAIGATSASMKLNIVHADQDGLRFNAPDGAETFIDFGDGSDNDIGGIRYDHADNHMRFRTNNAERMRIDSGGNAIFTKSGGAYLQLKDASGVRGAINVTTSDGLIFTTGVSFTERMRIDSSGNVGIGTTGDAAFGSGNGLEIQKAGVATLRLQNTANSNSFEIQADTTSNGIKFHGYNDAPFVFSPNATERMRIESNGRVGIGVSPSGMPT